MDLASLEFLMIQDTHITETAKLANVVLTAFILILYFSSIISIALSFFCLSNKILHTC